MKLTTCIAVLAAVPAFAAAPVSFKDAAKIKSWDAWNDHKGEQAWKERTNRLRDMKEEIEYLMDE